jgi:hypothetical protein
MQWFDDNGNLTATGIEVTYGEERLFDVEGSRKRHHKVVTTPVFQP